MSGKSRGDVMLYVVLLMVFIVGFLGWMVIHDEVKELKALDGATKKAWLLVQPCLYQRNAVVDLTARLFLKANGGDVQTLKNIRKNVRYMQPLLDAPAPSSDLLSADLAMERNVEELLRMQVPRFEKLPDLLAGSQNRLALRRMHYNKRAAHLAKEMHTLQGAVISQLLRIETPVLLDKPMAAHA